MSWSQLSGGAKAECLAYGVIAAVALVGTQWVLVDGITSGQMSGTQVWSALTANPTTVFVGIDLFLVFLAAMIYMVIEGIRQGLKWWLIYPILSCAIGISVGFPLFLIARRLRVSGQEKTA